MENSYKTKYTHIFNEYVDTKQITQTHWKEFQTHRL